MGAAPHGLVPYLLRTVRVGVRATYLAVLSLAVLLVLPHRLGFDRGLFLALLATALAGVVVIRWLPWDALLASGAGIWVLYAWSLLDIALITALVALAGGGESPLFVLYGLTTVFFAASYSPRAQAALLLVTAAAYVGVCLLDTSSQGPAIVVARLGVLSTIAFMSSFLSRELAAAGSAVSKLREAELRRGQALEINDNILQDLTVAKFSLERGDEERAGRAIDRALSAASALISDLVDGDRELPFVRSSSPPAGEDRVTSRA